MEEQQEEILNQDIPEITGTVKPIKSRKPRASSTTTKSVEAVEKPTAEISEAITEAVEEATEKENEEIKQKVKKQTKIKMKEKDKKKAKKAEAKEKAKQTRRNRLYIPSIKSLSRKVCPPGMIERKSFARGYSTAIRQRGYTVRRASGTSYRVYPKARTTTVKSQCVKNISKSAKGEKKIGPLRKGELHKHGYSFKLKEDVRRKALRQAVSEYGALGVYRKLNAVSKLSKSLAPQASNVFKSDRNWLTTKYGPLKAFD